MDVNGMKRRQRSKQSQQSTRRSTASGAFLRAPSASSSSPSSTMVLHRRYGRRSSSLCRWLFVTTVASISIGIGSSFSAPLPPTQQQSQSQTQQQSQQHPSSSTCTEKNPNNNKKYPIENVVVVGGTHGNEYTGVWCIKALDAQRKRIQESFPTLQISTLLANPEAHLANKRFIHTDLNREFHYEKLCAVAFEDDNDRNGAILEEESNGGGDMLDSIETARARELDMYLGSKCNGQEQVDVAIDLHSTTSNMGITLIINESDDLMAQGAAYVQMKCGLEYPCRCLMHSIPDKSHRPTLSSAAKHGFTVEVGPVPQGILRHDAVKKTDCALHALLEFLHRRNQEGGEERVMQELMEQYPDGKVPCYRTAPARRPGEISGKITWPSSPDNPNFPAVMVHESLQDKDFHLLKTGDPLFVELDGTVRYYEGSHGDSVYVVFVNEAGYYYASSGTGIGVAITTEYDLVTGMLIDHEQCDEASSMQCE